MKNKTAFITGITGQDGSYLLDNLLNKGYVVHGLVRRSSSFNTKRIDHIISNNKYKSNFYFHHGDITDSSNLNSLIKSIKPDEIYNLAAQSHVKVSFDIPDYTAQVDALGTLRILDIIKNNKFDTKFYQASTSELFGKVQETPQTEKTPFYPRSPYGVAKLYGFWIIKNYRESFKIFASNGILFNHESPRRGETFVSRKITIAVAKILAGLQDKLIVGNLNAKRDWGYAPEYVEGMWRILQLEQPEDIILATGECHTVREFINLAFYFAGINIEWTGDGIDEIGINKDNGKTLVSIDKKYFRPAEVNLLIGDPKKAKDLLNWEPKIKFEQLVELMVKSDIDLYKK